MPSYPRKRIEIFFAVCLIMAGVLFCIPLPARSTDIKSNLSDREFWQLVTTLSEPGGKFQDQLMSNKDSAQYVIPALKQTAGQGGIYIGVGTEQNFTFIAALPSDSSSTFIRSVTVDISRRLGISIPAGMADWRTFLFPIDKDLKAFANGRIRSYSDLFMDRVE